MTGIYKITNQINGKVYIGQSVNIEQRWKAHRSRPFNPKAPQYSSPLYKAIRKYGLINFTFEVIEECKQDVLNEKEEYYIALYSANDKNYGYNLTAGGSHAGKSIILSEKDIQTIIQLLRNSKLSEEKIAIQFGVSQRMISAINLGQSHIQSNIQYPIRDIRAKTNVCVDCGKKICKESVRCVSCANKYKAKENISNRPNREQLKKEIRTISFTQLGKKYNVSDNAIRKWCIAFNLPSKKSDIKKISDNDWSKI